VILHGHRAVLELDQSAGSFLASRGGSVLPSAEEGDRKVGSKAKAHGRAQALRPRFGGPERCRSPVYRPNELTHLTAARKPIIDAID
jgi:hypothetical protein